MCAQERTWRASTNQCQTIAKIEAMQLLTIPDSGRMQCVLTNHCQFSFCRHAWRASTNAVVRVFRIAILLVIFISASGFALAPCQAAHGKASHSANASHLAASRQKSAQVFAEKIIQTYGGAEVVRKVAYMGSRSFGRVIDYSTMSNASNSFDCTELSKGEKMRIEVNMMGVPEITAFNGQHGWIKQGEQTIETTKLMDMRIKDDLEHDGLLLLLKLLKPNTKLDLLGKQTVLGRPCQILKVTVGDGTPTLIYADQTTHLILKSKSEGIDTELGIAALKTYIYEDYRPLLGSQFPYKVTEYSGPKKVSEIVLAKIEQCELDDKIFEMPQSEAALLDKGQEISLPFDYLSNEIVIRARVNGQDDLLFIVDTGATQSLIDKSEAQKLGGFKDSSLTMTTGSGSMSLGYMTLSGLSLDSITLKNVQFAVADLSSFSQILGKHPAGLIGADILRRFLVTIDYENQELTLANPDSTIVLAADAIVLPTKPSLGMSGILLDGELDGQRVPFLVDSGAAFNNISTKLASPILARKPLPVLPIGTVEGLDGKKVKIGCVQFGQLKIGPLTIADPVFSLAPSDSNPTGVISTGDLAILGNPLWCRYKMTIDYKNERLILNRSKEVLEGEQLVNQLQAVEMSLPVTINTVSGSGTPCVPSVQARCLRSQGNESAPSSPSGGKTLGFDRSRQGRTRPQGNRSKPSSTANFGSQVSAGVVSNAPADTVERLIAKTPVNATALSTSTLSDSTDRRSALPAPADTIERLETILAEAKEKDLPGVAALCLADIAVATADQELARSKLETPASPTKSAKEQFQSISELFQEAEALADQAEAKQIQAQILAKWAMFYLTYLPKAQAVQSAKPLLTKAASCWNTEPTVFSATAVMLRKLQEDKLADRLVDQALMLNPVDRQALLLKYNLAKSQGNTNIEKPVTEQLKRCYGLAVE